MAENSKIEWTNHTFNPWIGCTKVSPGCANCYAETLMDKRLKQVNWGKGNPRKLTGKSTWDKVLAWNKAEGRQKVFVASLADWLDDEVEIEWLAWLLDHVRKCQNLDFLMLTKRPYLWESRIRQAMEYWRERSEMNDEIEPTHRMLAMWLAGHAPKNIWLGTSAEDQTRWDERMPILMSIPAGVRFVSAEPLLGPIEMGKHRPDWIIVGGESGPGARPMSDKWVRSLEKQSRQHGSETAFFFKQWGGVNKKEMGRELDGATYSEFPLNSPVLASEERGS